MTEQQDRDHLAALKDKTGLGLVAEKDGRLSPGQLHKHRPGSG